MANNLARALRELVTMNNQKSHRGSDVAVPVGNKTSVAFSSRGALFGALKDHFVPVFVSAGQRVALNHGSSPLVCLLDTGMMMLTSSLDYDRRTVLALMFAGDFTSGSFANPQGDVKLTALLPSRYLAVTLSDFEKIISDNQHLVPLYSHSCARLVGRQTLQISSLSMLTCEQKLATLLVDLALNIGRPANGGIQVDVPLSRRDIADYLALNMDTVSRTMSQFKTEGLVAAVGRRHLVVLKPLDLILRTPLGKEVLELHKNAACAALFSK